MGWICHFSIHHSVFPREVIDSFFLSFKSHAPGLNVFMYCFCSVSGEVSSNQSVFLPSDLFRVLLVCAQQWKYCCFGLSGHWKDMEVLLESIF